jgi:hypothetical protein
MRVPADEAKMTFQIPRAPLGWAIVLKISEYRKFGVEGQAVL